mgnify:CR=1 FL=1
MISREKYAKLVKAGANIYRIDTEVTPALLARANLEFTKNGVPEVGKAVRYFSDKYSTTRARTTLASLGAKFTVTSVPARSITLKEALNG